VAKGAAALGSVVGLATAGETGTAGAAFAGGADAVGSCVRSVGGDAAGRLLRAGLIQINGAGETFVGFALLRSTSSISGTDIDLGVLVAAAVAATWFVTAGLAGGGGLGSGGM